eukprot:Seg1674.4 transcript_id=Seg1674.4/GoldUCD/mRNA.D3Y31 product="hypothetical protein" protein_id=Seg1674.4/GoldUCD/D3Y31
MYHSTSGYRLQGSTTTKNSFNGSKHSKGCEEKARIARPFQFKLPDIHRNDMFVSGVPPDYRTDKTLYFKRQINHLCERAEYGNCSAHGPESNIVHEYCGDCDSHCEDCHEVAAEMHQSFLKDRNNFSRMFHERIPVCTCGLKPGPSISTKRECVAHNKSIAAYKSIKKRNAVCKRQPGDSNEIRVRCGRSNKTVNDRCHLPSIRTKNKLHFPAKSRNIGQLARLSDWSLDK